MLYSFFNSVDNDRVYNAADFAKYFNEYFTRGVFWRTSESLAVVAGSGSTVDVQKGSANIDGYTVFNDSVLTLPVAVGDAQYSRIDAACVLLDLDNRLMDIVIVSGTPSSDPVRPSIVDTATKKYLTLAYITVPAQSASTSDANITDTRLDNSVCGIVTQAVESVDTTALYRQFSEQLAAFMSASSNDFQEWFDAIKAELESVEVGEIAGRVAVLEQEQTRAAAYIYKCTGTGDNVALSNMVNSYLAKSGAGSIKIEVQGETFNVGSTIGFNGSNYDLVFAVATTTQRRAFIDFSSCGKITSNLGYGIYANSQVVIRGLNFETSGNTGLYSVGARLERSLITARQYAITGTHVYAIDCKLEATGIDDTCAGVFCGGYLENCDVVAASTSSAGLGASFGAMGARLKDVTQPLNIVGGSYRGYVKTTAGTSEGIGIYVPAGMTTAVLNVRGARCPQVVRAGYAQSNAIKINTGYGSVMGCACYIAPAVYSAVNFLVGGNVESNLTSGLT